MASALGVISKSDQAVEIDIDALLAPIPGDNPAGANLKYAGLYDEINEARREDEDLVQGEWRHERKIADWPRVVRLASEALATRTKDLQVCAWLLEALVKTRWLDGMRDGLITLRGLVERHWEHLYPEMDEGDLEARANAIASLERPAVLPKLPRALKDAPMSGSVTGLSYSYLQWEQSNEFDIPEQLDDLDSDEIRQINELKQRAADEGKITSEQWRFAKAATPRRFYEETYSKLGACWAELHALDVVLDQKFGSYAPGLSLVKKTVDEMRNLSRRSSS